MRRRTSAIFTTDPLIVAACLVAVLAVLAALSAANRVPAAGALDARRGADAIVTGKVMRIASAWDRERRRINSSIDVRVQRTLKGATPDIVTITQPGGRVGRIGQLIVGQPRYAAGEQVKLYLDRIGRGMYKVRRSERLGGGGPLDAAGAVTHPGGTKSPRSSPGYDWDGWRWPKSKLPVSYWVSNQFDDEENAAVQASFSVWEDDPESSMDYTYRGETILTGQDRYDGYNVVTKGNDESIGGGAIAYCMITYSASNILETDIVFNYADYAWATNGTDMDKIDVQNVGAHEAGHTLMLDDLGTDLADQDETMWWSTTRGETKNRTLEAGDLAGVRTVYPHPSAPPDVTGFVATPGDGKVTLSWRNPTTTGFAGVRLLKQAGMYAYAPNYPEGSTDGTLVCTGTMNSFSDEGLDNGTTYYYLVCTHDADGHYSSGALAQARPGLATTVTASIRPTLINYAGSVRISSAIAPSHEPTAQLLYLQTSTNGSTWSTLYYPTLTRTAYAGLYQIYTSAKARTYYRVRWDGDADHHANYSPRLKVSVRPKLVVAPYVSQGSIRVMAYVYPRHDGKRCILYFERYSRGWRRAATLWPKLYYFRRDRSRARAIYRPSRHGRWRVRLRFYDADHYPTIVASRGLYL